MPRFCASVTHTENERTLARSERATLQNITRVRKMNVPIVEKTRKPVKSERERGRDGERRKNRKVENQASERCSRCAVRMFRSLGKRKQEYKNESRDQRQKSEEK